VNLAGFGVHTKRSAEMPARINAEPPVVLLVEDELLIRMSAADMITEAGFTVIEAADADEAIGILENRSDISIVFTDVNMPGSMDGLKLAHFVRDRWPPIRLIVTSGHLAIPDQAIPSGGRFFPKPYRYGELVQTLRDFA
jgi:CheY-like chemotaxis protein